MEEQDYLENRLQNQIDWYSKKSAYNQRWHKRLLLVQILLSVSIPFMATYINETENEFSNMKFVVGLMGVCIALIAGIMNIYKFNENWIEYRKTSETLKQEKYLFMTKSGIYNQNPDSNNSYNSLVSKVESIIANENSNWGENLGKKEEGK